jgi:hypothetical protein
MNLRPVLLLTLALAALGCGPKKTDARPAPDQDFNSGPDAKRTGAVRIEINKLSPPDEVNYDKGDQTDWKSVELKGKPGLLTVELHWDNARSDMNLDLFDGVGTNIASSPGPQPGAQEKKLVAQIDQVGVYFIRITAVKQHDGSVYTVEAKWEGEPPPAPPAPPKPPVVEETPPPVEKPKHHEHVEHHEHHASHAARTDYENGVQGRIVSSYREGGTMVLHIDKGSAAGVRVGSGGSVLDGPSGANPLDGGTFTITQVVDENKCIAKSNLHSIGRNTRVSIFVK